MRSAISPRSQDTLEITAFKGVQIKPKDVKLGKGLNFVFEFVDHNSLKREKLGALGFNKAVYGKYQFLTLIIENHSLPIKRDYEIYLHGYGLCLFFKDF